MGGNAAIARKYRCPIVIPEGEREVVERWDDRRLLLAYADQTAERFRADDYLLPGATCVWGDLEWRALAAPGHDMGALVFHNPEHRILISGDALWEHGFGFVMPPEFDPAALPATRATVEMLAGLDIRVVIPGHGEPFTGVAAALDRALQRIVAFEADPLRMARHAVRVVFMFGLLDRQRMPIADIPAHVERVPVYRDFNARYLRMSSADLAAWLLAELEKAGAVRREGADVVPA
jgi:glyoxylase-like metal-dependent hydrolase (beta-lactamase superfamily II)